MRDDRLVANALTPLRSALAAAVAEDLLEQTLMTPVVMQRFGTSAETAPHGETTLCSHPWRGGALCPKRGSSGPSLNALATLRIAARHFGYRAAVDALPDASDEDLLARVSFEPGDRPGDEQDELFLAIPLRRTNRQPFEQRELPADLAELLVAEARDEGVGLHLASGDDRAAIAEFIAEGDRIQMATSAFDASWRRGCIRIAAAAATACAATGSASVTSWHTPGRL